MTSTRGSNAERCISFPLAHRVDLPVLGINVLFATNSTDVLAIIDEAFGGWQCVADAERDASLVVNVDIVVRHADLGRFERADQNARVVRHFLPDAERLVAYAPGSIGMSDPGGCRAVATVAPQLVADRARFRETMLEALTFALLASRDRHPLHAAAIARNGHAVLLAGASGSGKSTLAHHAHAAGITVMSEDRVWIQQLPAMRVWGMPGHARLLPHGAAAKSEKVAVLLDGTQSGSEHYVARDATVCVLEQRRGAATLERVSSHEIVQALTQQVDAGFDRFPGRHSAVVSTLAACGGWRLTLSNDPRDALPLLETMLDRR